MNETFAEHIAVPVSDRRSLTPYVFYNYLLPALRSCLRQKRPSLISLDMTDVASVSPLVLPNLVVVGKQLSEHFGTPGSLILSTRNTPMLEFLKGMGFFRLLDQYPFFQYDKGFVHPLDSATKGDLAAMAYIPPGSSSSDHAFRQLLRDNKSIDNFVDHFKTFRMATVFGKTVGELAHNCSKHGRSFAVLSVYGGPKLGLQCAVSDCGIGYRSSLLEHPTEIKVYSVSELRTPDSFVNFKAIIEAVCRRLGHETYGLSSVIRDIARVGGTTRVHSVDTQVVFTPQNQSGLPEFQEVVPLESANRRLAGHSLAEHMLALAKGADSPQTSPVRQRESKLAGVHVEFELPPADRQGEKRLYD